MFWKYYQSRLQQSRYLKLIELHRLDTGQQIAPSYVLWDCTRRCNLNCIHCGASKERYDTELSTSEVKDFISQLAPMGVKTFAVTGGEPLLRDDLLEILSYAKSLNIHTGIATNGFLLDQEMAISLRKAGVSSMQISLDGDEVTHNSIRRNPDSFRRALNAARYCQSVKMPLITISTVVTLHNLHILPALLNLLLENKISHWKIIPLMPIGRAEKNPLQIDPLAFAQLMAFIHASRKSINILVGENLPYLGKYDSAARHAVTMCPVGISVCCLGVDGKIRGCPEMPDTDEFIEGSILKTPFAEIWQKGFSKYRLETLKKLDPKCSKCQWWSKCRGGCWVMRTGGTHCIKNWI